jgi:glycosyltransferase involved in cell wall biosynthesis
VAVKPVISIIVPVHNVDSHLRKCLDSILAQTFTDFEVIVVNDGSSDGSGYICDAYAKQDERVKVMHKEYKGVSAARNTGVECAAGDFIGFVDSDDYIDRNMYQTLYQLCLDTQSDISICTLGREIDGVLINKGTEKIYSKKLDHQEAMRELFKGMLYRFSLCNKLFKRTCFDGVQFPEGRIHEDLATTYKLFANANQAVFTNYIGYIYVKQQKSILTSSYHEKRLDAFRGWDEILNFIHRAYPQLTNEVNACFVYFCTDHIYAILRQVSNKEERKQYLNTIQQTVKKNYRSLRKNTMLSVNYRFIISIINYNISLFAVAHWIKHVRGKRNETNC